MDDYERLIEVIFHEIGHIVCFALQVEKSKGESDKLKKKYGVSDERIDSWDQQIIGYEVVTSEEDPDTLSYGTYTNWAILFA